MISSSTSTSSIFDEKILLTNLMWGTDCPRKVNDLKKSLDQLKVITELVLASLVHLKAMHLKLFDPLVGDTACHIRASMVCDISKYLSGDLFEEEFKKISDFAAKIDELADELSGPLAKRHHMKSLSTFLSEFHAQVEIPSMIRIITFSHLLTITRTLQEGYEIDPNTGHAQYVASENTSKNNLSKQKNVTNSFAKDLDEFARAFIADASVKYVQQQASGDEHLSSLVHESRIRLFGRGLQTLPCLSVIQVLFKKALENNTPILLKIDQVDQATAKVSRTISQLYLPMEGHFELIDPQVMENSPALVFECASINNGDGSKNSLIENLDLEEMIMGNFATHTQYPDCDEELLDHAMREKSRAIGQEKGYCHENPAVCEIHHIRPGTTHEEISINF